jgi:hypothetical protein
VPTPPFSLYGIRKEEEKHNNNNRRVRDWRGCSRKHFIDSYFTYGGADVLLQAVGIQPDVYYSNRNYAYQDGQRVLEDAAAANDDDAAAVANDDAAAAAENDDDDSYTVTSNAECIQVDGSDVTHYHSSNNNNNNNNGQERQQEQEEYTYMSTMGCSRTTTTPTTTTTNAAEATFVMARFEADTCDGNKYLDTLDAMDSYNAQHDSIGNCHRIWDAQWTDTNNNNNSNNNSSIFYLMQNAWTCDFALYPDGCPDPYGQKAKFLHALQIAARGGGNAQLSLRNMNAKRPLRIISVVFGWRWEPWSSCGDIT